LLLLIRVRVADYAKWKSIFDERQSSRTQHGGKRHWIYRSADDGNDVAISIEFPTADQAKAYAADPGLREAMSRAGVSGQPEFAYLEETEAKTY
jgi:hypothetical protein